jgi:hypothetical protein
MMSSMALFAKRIEIRQHGRGYFKGTTVISHVDREAFLQELVSRCHNLEEMKQRQKLVSDTGTARW